MWFEQDNRIEEDMSEAVEGGATLAWRLLATLEGGSLLLASSALLAYSVRKKIAGQHRPGRNIRRVLVTNTTNTLGRELKRRLEERGCVVDTVTHTSRGSNETASLSSNGTATLPSNGTATLPSNGTASLLSNGTASLPNNDASIASEINDVRAPKVDAIVVIGAEPKADGLDGMARLVNEDVYNNLKLLESQSHRVRYGGCIAWACAGDAGAAAGAFSVAGAAFDTVLHASLQHVAKVCHCEPIWVGRCEGVEQTAQRVVSALLSSQDSAQTSRFSVRNAAHRVGEYLCRWLKIVT